MAEIVERLSQPFLARLASAHQPRNGWDNRSTIYYLRTYSDRSIADRPRQSQAEAGTIEAVVDQFQLSMIAECVTLRNR